MTLPYSVVPSTIRIPGRRRRRQITTAAAKTRCPRFIHAMLNDFIRQRDVLAQCHTTLTLQRDRVAGEVAALENAMAALRDLQERR